MRVYRVEIGFTEEDGNEIENWAIETFIAKDFDAAVKKAKSLLKRKEFIVDIEQVMTLTK